MKAKCKCMFLCDTCKKKKEKGETINFDTPTKGYPDMPSINPPLNPIDLTENPSMDEKTFFKFIEELRSLLSFFTMNYGYDLSVAKNPLDNNITTQIHIIIHGFKTEQAPKQLDLFDN